MNFGGFGMDPFSLFQQQDGDIFGSIAEGAVKGILKFLTEKKSKSVGSLTPHGMQILQQIQYETQTQGPIMPEMAVQRAMSLGLPQEEATAVAFHYALGLLKVFVIGNVVQQAIFQEIMTGVPAEHNVAQFGMLKGLQPQEIQAATQMIMITKGRRPLIKQTVHQILALLQNQPLSPMQVYQYALQSGLMPMEALFVAEMVDFLK